MGEASPITDNWCRGANIAVQPRLETWLLGTGKVHGKPVKQRPALRQSNTEKRKNSKVFRMVRCYRGFVWKVKVAATCKKVTGSFPCCAKTVGWKLHNEGAAMPI